MNPAHVGSDFRGKKKYWCCVMAVVRHGGRQDFGVRSRLEKSLGTADRGGLAALGSLPGAQHPTFLLGLPERQEQLGAGVLARQRRILAKGKAASRLLALHLLSGSRTLCSEDGSPAPFTSMKLCLEILMCFSC